MVRITLNGADRDVAAATLEDLIAELGMADQRLAAERNRELVPRRLWPATPLHPGDRLEIVQMVGGG